MKKLLSKIPLPSIRQLILLIVGGGLLAFGLYNVHSISNITEGGALGLTLLFDHLFSWSPAVTGLIMNAISYFIGWRTLGNAFIVNSAVSALSFSGFYAVFEQFPRVYPEIAEMPLVSAIVGALFVGIGVGMCVRANGAPTGDDALAMSIDKVTPIKIDVAYLIMDVVVLGASLCYIPIERILYSLVTVIISGQLIKLIQRAKFSHNNS